MKNKITVLSSCPKKDVLALVIIWMGVLQDTLPIFYFKALPQRTFLGTGEFLQVTVSALYCLKIFNALISTTVSLPTKPSGEQPRNGNSGLT